MKTKPKTILQLAKEYLGKPCHHPYHEIADCPYLEMRPEELKKFAKWADRKLKQQNG